MRTLSPIGTTTGASAKVRKSDERLTGIEAAAQSEVAVLRDRRKQDRRQHQVLEHDLRVVSDAQALPEVRERTSGDTRNRVRCRRSPVHRHQTGMRPSPAGGPASRSRRGRGLARAIRRRSWTALAGRPKIRHGPIEIGKCGLETDGAVCLDPKTEVARDDGVARTVRQHDVFVDPLLCRIRVRAKKVRRDRYREWQRVHLQRACAVQAGWRRGSRSSSRRQARRQSALTGRAG